MKGANELLRPEATRFSQRVYIALAALVPREFSEKAAECRAAGDEGGSRAYQAASMRIHEIVLEGGAVEQSASRVIPSALGKTMEDDFETVRELTEWHRERLRRIQAEIDKVGAAATDAMLQARDTERSRVDTLLRVLEGLVNPRRQPAATEPGRLVAPGVPEAAGEPFPRAPR